MIAAPPRCTICDCTAELLRRIRKHNSETCKNVREHRMEPIRDTGYWYCPEHDG